MKNPFLSIPAKRWIALGFLFCLLTYLGWKGHLPLVSPSKFSQQEPKSVPVEITFDSVGDATEHSMTFYLIAIDNADNKHLLTAATFTNETSELTGGRIANKGHGLWSSLPSMGEQLHWKWSGFLPVTPGETLSLVAGSSRPGSRLKTKLDVNGHVHEQVIEIPNGTDTSTSRTPLITLRTKTVRGTVLLSILHAMVFCGVLLPFLRTRTKSTSSRRKMFEGDALAFSLLAFPFSAVLVVAVLLLLGGTVRIWVWIPTIVLHGFLAKWYCRTFGKRFLPAFVASVAITLVTVIVSSSMWGVDYDENAFHHAIPLLLKDGWNPIYQECPSPEITGPDGIYLPMGAHIPTICKGQAYVSALLVTLTNHPESGNFSNVVFMLVCGLMAFQVLSKTIAGPKFLHYALSVAIAMNPIALAQWQTGFVDGRMGSLLCTTILLLYGWIQTQDRRFIHFLALAIPMTLCSKLSAVAYLGITTVFALVPAFVKGKLCVLPLLKVYALAGFLGIVMGFNPYCVNIRRHGTPLYPVMGHSDHRFTTSEKYSGPDAIKRLSKGKAFIASHIVASTGSSLPNDLSRVSDYTGISVSTWIGMNGPLHNKIVFPLALFIFCILVLRCDSWLLMFPAGILVSLFLCPVPWYSRYIPQLSMFSCMLVAVILSKQGGNPSSSGKRMTVSVLLVYLLLANSLLVAMRIVTNKYFEMAATGHLLREVSIAGEVHYLDTDPKNMRKFKYMNKRRLANLGIACHDVSNSNDRPIQYSWFLHGVGIPPENDKNVPLSGFSDVAYGVKAALRETFRRKR